MQEGQRTIARMGAGLMTAMLIASSTGRATRPVIRGSGGGAVVSQSPTGRGVVYAGVRLADGTNVLHLEQPQTRVVEVRSGRVHA